MSQKFKTILNDFIGIVNKSKRKPNKYWVTQGKNLYKNFIQKLLDDSNTWMYLTYKESRSVAAERLMRTLKCKIYEIMTANNSRSCLYYLNKLVDKYNNSYHSSIGKKSIYANYSALTEEIETNH